MIRRIILQGMKDLEKISICGLLLLFNEWVMGRIGYEKKGVDKRDMNYIII